MKKQIKLIWIIIILFSQVSQASIVINEIMVKPTTDQNLNEWIEIYNTGSEQINLSSWKIKDNMGEDFLIGGNYNEQGTIIKPNSYALITAETTRVYNNFKVMFNTTKLYVAYNKKGIILIRFLIYFLLNI